MSSTPAALRELATAVRYQAGQGRLQRGMALLTALGSFGNGLEAYTSHVHGAFESRWMWTPVVIAPLAGMIALTALFSRRVARHILPWASLVLFADGLAGTLLHARGIRRMPGGLKMGAYNITMGPPIFAPLLLGSVGLFGLVAALLRPAPAAEGVRAQ